MLRAVSLRHDTANHTAYKFDCNIINGVAKLKMEHRWVFAQFITRIAVFLFLFYFGFFFFK